MPDVVEAANRIIEETLASLTPRLDCQWIRDPRGRQDRISVWKVIYS